MSVTYHDTANPTLKTGTQLFSVGDCEKYVANNHQALKDQLEVTLGLIPTWKQDYIKSGIPLAAPVLNEKWKPLPWLIERIVTHLTGFQSLFLECKKSEFHSDKLTVQSNDLDGAFVESFDSYVSKRMQSTADKMIADKKSFDESEESKRKAQREIDLIKAKKLLARDAEMPDFQRNALHAGAQYAASIRSASELITSATVSKKTAQKRVATAKKAAERKAQAKASAERSYDLRKRMTALTHKKIGLAEKRGTDLSDLETELKEHMEAEAAAKSTLSTFQC